MSERAYEGSELDLFAAAVNWKAYLRARIRPYLRGAVLEVGAGNGSNTLSLRDASEEITRWVCLEPDPRLAGEIRARGLAAEVRVGTASSLEPGELFDCILYIDVLEHIEDDRGEVERIAKHLAPGGALVVLAPAHQFLFSPFDRAIGHFRRYDKRSLRDAADRPSLRRRELTYLDSVGLCASLANSCLMRQSMPTASQIALWDRLMVRASRLFDPLTGFKIGKSLLGVWEKI